MITIVTVGYGDFSAKSGIEMIMVIVFSLISSVVIGYNLNSIGNLIDKMVENDRFYDDKLKKLNKYMKINNVSEFIREKVRQHIEN